jgi:hypothetical protein
MIDPSSMPLTALAPLIAMAAGWFVGALAAIFGASALPLVLSYDLRYPRRRDRVLSRLYGLLMVTFGMLTLLDLLPVGAPHSNRYGFWAVILASAVALIGTLAPTLPTDIWRLIRNVIEEDRRFFRNLRVRRHLFFSRRWKRQFSLPFHSIIYRAQTIVPYLAVIFLWWITYGLMLTIAFAFGQSAEIKETWIIDGLVLALLTSAGNISLLASRRKFADAAWLLLVAVAGLIYWNSFAFFSVPYKLLHLANYPVKVLLSEQDAKILSVFSCDAVIRDRFRRNVFTLQVLSSIGNYYVARCAAKERGWIAIPKRGNFLLGSDALKWPN